MDYILDLVIIALMLFLYRNILKELWLIKAQLKKTNTEIRKSSNKDTDEYTPPNIEIEGKIISENKIKNMKFGKTKK